LKKNGQRVGFAQELRRKQRGAEKALWARSRNRQLEGVKFQRQQPIDSYVLDFASYERKLIVEINGGQHNEGKIKEGDEERTIRLGKAVTW
jgi:very-short-patch-repair endonuclease